MHGPGGADLGVLVGHGPLGRIASCVLDSTAGPRHLRWHGFAVHGTESVPPCGDYSFPHCQPDFGPDYASSVLTRLALAAFASLLLAPAAAEADPPSDLGADAIWVWSWDEPDALASDLTAGGFERADLDAEAASAEVRNAIAALDGRVAARGARRREALGDLRPVRDAQFAAGPRY